MPYAVRSAYASPAPSHAPVGDAASAPSTTARAAPMSVPAGSGTGAPGPPPPVRVRRDVGQRLGGGLGVAERRDTAGGERGRESLQGQEVGDDRLAAPRARRAGNRLGAVAGPRPV